MLRETLAAMFVALACCAAGAVACGTPPPDPMVAPYMFAARTCALSAAGLDAGREVQWAAYDACERRAWQMYAPDAGREGP